MQRPLSLHVSALSEEEYRSFTNSFYDLLGDNAHLDDDAFNKETVSLREARAWLRGRYADMQVASVDEALRLFAPDGGKDAVLSGGQFFALLRVIMHMREGQKLDRKLAFDQVHLPKSVPVTRKSFDAPPRHPAPPRSRQPSANSVFDAPTSDNNPFHNLPQDPPPPVPPLHPDVRLGTVSAPSAISDTPPQPTKHHSNNPFVSVSRSKTIHTTTRPSVINIDKAPPSLPPRKAPPVIPPRTNAPLVPASATASSSKPAPPPVAPKLPHLTSSLMKQSLLASRAAQDAKRAEEERNSTRVFQVLKSSTGSTGSASPPKLGSRSSSSSDERQARPKLPPRRQPSPPPSAASVYSFEQVASASLPDGRSPFRRPPTPPGRVIRSPSTSPSRPTTDSAPRPPPRQPPRHPDSNKEKSENGDLPSTTPPRLGRSKSMHQTTPPPLPPPSRRKRPESVQVLSNSPRQDVFSDAHAAPFPPPPPLLSARHPSFKAAAEHSARHSSFSGASPSSQTNRHARQQSVEEGAQAALNQFRGAFAGLAPKIDAARYKAEAGLSRRGYVPGMNKRRTEGAQRLVDSDEEEEDGGVAGPSVIEEEEDGLGSARSRDDMKWPAGDGWRSLR
ncbi:hypothetical protein PENSPDRAFT_689153 [Peniophora sp. CONT]|nr:hypothetical protein PENSPDRAFT_689153 [Peniophora sp. CONT]